MLSVGAVQAGFGQLVRDSFELLREFWTFGEPLGSVLLVLRTARRPEPAELRGEISGEDVLDAVRNDGER
eukprot:2325923-Alexandrium_andersonii.AAC.1